MSLYRFMAENVVAPEAVARSVVGPRTLLAPFRDALNNMTIKLYHQGDGLVECVADVSIQVWERIQRLTRNLWSAD